MRESPYPLVSVDDALRRVLQHVAPLPAAMLPLLDARGHTLAEDVVAPAAQPPFPASTVDGFALRTADGLQPRRIAGEQMAGHMAALTVQPGDAVRITTGAPLPAGADAVVMVEQADEAAGWVTPHAGFSLTPGDNVRGVGFDVQAGQTVLPAGRVLGPAEIGLLASLGLQAARVYRRPVVGVFSTGDELAAAEAALQPGQIYDSNRPALLTGICAAGGVPLDLGIVPDQRAALQAALARGLRTADLLVTSGGASMGELDLLKPLLAEQGDILFGRVRVKPGKPLALAMLPRPAAQPLPVFALPGNPVSALVTFTLFVRPAIRRLGGHSAVSLPRLMAVLGHDLPRDAQRPEFHRVHLRREGGRVVARSTGAQASSRLLSTAGADGLLMLEQGEGVLCAGTERPVLLLNDAWLSESNELGEVC